ncbi:hypothetical protein QBC44DRAFT_399601 [Cladorrhinum sp. PSN332]|nr:hypothetical protein QBC44DRAFT_399601 [Cladorrhinum sp. PSN332]
MPTYLAHAFRWHRKSIIIHSIIQNLDNCSPDWICSPNSSACILDSFSTLYNIPPPSSNPDTTTSDDGDAPRKSPFTLLEQYDPSNLSSASAPYAYVADHVVKIDLSCDLAEEIKKYDGKDGLLEKLRDEIEKGEEVKWYVVVCGDEERGWPGKDEEEEDEEEEDEEEDEGVEEEGEEVEGERERGGSRER